LNDIEARMRTEVDGDPREGCRRGSFPMDTLLTESKADFERVINHAASTLDAIGAWRLAADQNAELH
jgi:hypothetical protein